MRVDQATQTGATVQGLMGRPDCPRCGEPQFAAAATDFLGRGRILNTWSCEACDYVFQTAVRIAGASR